MDFLNDAAVSTDAYPFLGERQRLAGSWRISLARPSKRQDVARLAWSMEEFRVGWS